MADVLSAFAAVVITLAPQNAGDRNIELRLLSGHDCSIAETVDLKSCKSMSAAEVVINGNVVDSMPIGMLTDDEVKRLVEMMDSYTMVSRKALAEAQRLAKEAK